MADVNEEMNNEMTTSPFGENLLTESYEVTPSEEKPEWVRFVEGLATGVAGTLAAGGITWFLTKKGRQEKREAEIDRRVEEKLISLGIIPNKDDEEEESEE